VCCRGSLHPATQDILNDFEEVAGVNGFDKVRMGAQAIGGFDIAVGLGGSENDHWQRLEDRLLADPF
jgi:hypothetical protein